MSPLSDSSAAPVEAFKLTREEKRTLLEIARQALVETIVHGTKWEPELTTGRLAEPRSAFVTLEQRGRLRGCVGQVFTQNSLVRTVARCSIAAAREDNRFRPVDASEAAELVIEISVLSPMDSIKPEQIEIGRHGLFVVRSGFRGLLLPQVPVEHHWTRERFLSEVCIKAGLTADAWTMPGTEIHGFTAQVFNELESYLDDSAPVEDHFR